MIRFKQYLLEKHVKNIAKVELKHAKQHSQAKFISAGKDLDKELPDFDKNYMLIQKSVKKALDIPRIDMPVIEPADMNKFKSDLKAGKIDIFKPFVYKHEYFPKDLVGGTAKAKEFLHLGLDDGDGDDDKVKVVMKKIEVGKLKPTQSEIWLEKVIDNIIKFGTAKTGSPVTETPIIVSKDGFILDGHHRYGQAMISNPKLKMNTVYVPIKIDLLLKMGRSYGNAVGNKQKQ